MNRACVLNNKLKLLLSIGTSSVSRKQLCTSSLCCNWRKIGSGNIERILQTKDELPESFLLIYRAPMENYLTWTKNISTATVSIVALMASYQYMNHMNSFNFTSKLDTVLSDLVSYDNDLYYFVGGFFLINLAIRAFVAKYPLRIYKSSDKYVAVYSSQMPMGTVKHHFNKGEIAEHHNFLNPWSHIMYKLGNRSSLLLMDYFKTPAEFQQLFIKDSE